MLLSIISKTLNDLTDPKPLNGSVHRYTTIIKHVVAKPQPVWDFFCSKTVINFPLQLPQDLSLKSPQRSSCNSVLRIPPSAQSSPNRFVTSPKINFKVTSCREDPPLIAYNTPPWFPCLFNFPKATSMQPSNPAPSPDLTSSPASQEASVIAKAVDLSVAKHKTLQWRHLKFTTPLLFSWYTYNPIIKH